MSGILARVVVGCLEYQALGLAAPDEVRSATQEYREEQNTVADFVQECCVRTSAGQVRAHQLYDVYCAWAGRGALSQTKFGLAVAKLGIQKKKSKGTWYIGITLTAKVDHGKLICPQPFDEASPMKVPAKETES